MEFQREHTPNYDRYYLAEPPAEIAFHTEGNRIVIEHTEVAEAWRGKNVGRQLVDRVVEEARERGMKITPLCPFARKVMMASDEYADVL